MKCCLSCGRDTQNTSGYCNKCFGHGSQIDDRKDRPVIHFDGDPICLQVNQEFEDDYSEDSMITKQGSFYFSKGEETKRFNRLRKIYNDS